ncbi:hypothetical protein J4205_02565 [Candidatus Pacearchaeota archaeon]|nr:hypothetical protein [Candidatus Pacearchaeota archaeon]
MSRYHVVLDRVVMAAGFLDSGDSVSHFTPEALKRSIDLKLVELGDIYSDKDSRVVRHIKDVRIAALRDEARLDLRALRKKIMIFMENVLEIIMMLLGDYNEIIK